MLKLHNFILSNFVSPKSQLLFRYTEHISEVRTPNIVQSEREGRNIVGLIRKGPQWEMESHRKGMESLPRPLRKITELDDCLEEDLPVPLPSRPWRAYLGFLSRHLIHALMLTKVHEWVASRWPDLLRRLSPAALLLALCLLSMVCGALISKVKSRS